MYYGMAVEYDILVSLGDPLLTHAKTYEQTY